MLIGNEIGLPQTCLACVIEDGPKLPEELRVRAQQFAAQRAQRLLPAGKRRHQRDVLHHAEQVRKRLLMIATLPVFDPFIHFAEQLPDRNAHHQLAKDRHKHARH